jgi:hypothetical protein
MNASERTNEGAKDRQRALQHSALVNNLKALVRKQVGLWLEAVIKHCMDPSSHLDLKRADLQLRMEAMDALFACRVILTQSCLDYIAAGLESPTSRGAHKDSEPGLTREDA